MAVQTKLTRKDLKLLDLIMSGEAARMCRVDRRTFWKKAAEWKVEQAATIEGRAVYHRKDILKMAERIAREKIAKKEGR